MKDKKHIHLSIALIVLTTGVALGIHVMHKQARADDYIFQVYLHDGLNPVELFGGQDVYIWTAPDNDPAHIDAGGAMTDDGEGWYHWFGPLEAGDDNWFIQLEDGFYWEPEDPSGYEPIWVGPLNWPHPNTTSWELIITTR